MSILLEHPSFADCNHVANNVCEYLIFVAYIYRAKIIVQQFVKFIKKIVKILEISFSQGDVILLAVIKWGKAIG